jgi:hypothetical protein
MVDPILCYIGYHQAKVCLGDERTVQRLEKKAKRKLEILHQWPVKRARLESKALSLNGQLKGEPKDDVLNFLKSRPQIENLYKATAKNRQAGDKEAARTVAGDEAPDFLNHDRFKGVASAWQHDETVDAFLKRAPIMDPRTAMLGPWLWVENPQIKRSQSLHERKANTDAFIEGGERLLAEFSASRTKIEQSMPDKPPAIITRKLRPYKEQLENDLRALAVRTSLTSGKWMLFPSDEDYPRCWRLAVEGTAQGRLGILSKAATPSTIDPVNLICVYTYDFTDMVDVQRVLEALVDLGLCRKDGSPIYYKCDGYTYLDIKSGNEYKLRASLYSSKEIFAKEAKPEEDGQISRVEKNSHMMDEFFAF